jgi:hypothetical protein
MTVTDQVIYLKRKHRDRLTGRPCPERRASMDCPLRASSARRMCSSQIRSSSLWSSPSKSINSSFAFLRAPHDVIKLELTGA